MDNFCSLALAWLPGGIPKTSPAALPVKFLVVSRRSGRHNLLGLFGLGVQTALSEGPGLLSGATVKTTAIPIKLQDRFGRVIDNLRISITDRCNFRCIYCMPAEGLKWMPRDHLLSYEEMARLVQVFLSLGVSKIRLTGGEPLVRADLPDLVRLLARLPGLKDLSVTTNGVLLEEQARPLAEAGLERLNISIDSMVHETFERLARRDALDRVMRGLEVAARCLKGPIKLNTVLIRGINDHEVLDFARLARRSGFEVRFIEFMPLDAQRQWSLERMVSGEEVREAIHAEYPLEPDPEQNPHAPSQDWVFADGAGGKIGFINSVSEPFCDQCNRVRITADGKLRTCLFSIDETDLLSLVRGGKSDAEIAAAIRAAVWDKEPGHKINQPDFVPASRSMSQIGG